MNMQSRLLPILALTLSAGCAQLTGSGRAAPQVPVPRSAPAAAAQAGQPLITRLLFDYTPAAQKQVADDEKFNDAALVRMVGQDLAANGLADLANSAVVRVAAIEVDEFDLRAASNVVMMGRLASIGVLGGTVRIRDGRGVQSREFHVRAEVAMNVRQSGQDKKGLEDLYREFAALVVDELTGTVRQPKQKRSR
jgi:hypothetical protein